LHRSSSQVGTHTFLFTAGKVVQKALAVAVLCSNSTMQGPMKNRRA
jgi:hypothetical protein